MTMNGNFRYYRFFYIGFYIYMASFCGAHVVSNKNVMKTQHRKVKERYNMTPVLHLSTNQ